MHYIKEKPRHFAGGAVKVFIYDKRMFLNEPNNLLP